MAATPNFGWVYPTINADADTWGDILNDAIIAIDATLKSIQTGNRFTDFANTTAYSTSSVTAVMAGFGGSWALTPADTGRVRVRITGNLQQINAGSSAAIFINYGTGTAPAQGTASSGTHGHATEYALSGVAGIAPFTAEFELTGLTLATAYWFDIALRAPGNTNATVTPISVIIEEF